ncbi:hypothetical protein NL676_001058 [Syzygium grande]|nr:hypothetical protein NL676_001058 [Syzygium grande]
MSAEQVFELFDSFWFHCAIFGDKSSSSATRPSHEGRGDEDDDDHDRLLLETKLSRAPTIHVRSMSDQFLGGRGLGSHPFSPNSVLLAAATPKLQTILSGKEVSDFEGEDETTKSEGEAEESRSQPGRSKKSENVGRFRKKRSKSSKSLSELEFQELKGFMDLGFVFSEQDRDDSDLVSILPGLQRLGSRDGGDRIEVQDKKADEAKVPRPYLSEAWDGLDRQRKRYEDPLVNWRVPAVGNEMAMKDHLRSWAHTVASTVR